MLEIQRGNESRKLKRMIYIFCFIILLGNGSVAFAANDKKHVELTCGDTKASIDCTKFADLEKGDHICVASTLSFDTKNGKHIVSSHKAPQHFSVPTIADDLTCLNTSEKILFIVLYRPDCEYAQCTMVFLYDLDGNFVAGNHKSYSKAVGNGKQILYPAYPMSPITLRGDQR